jgi:hypothetical protein
MKDDKKFEEIPIEEFIDDKQDFREELNKMFPIKEEIKLKQQLKTKSNDTK